jgi:hypothetical protein
MTDDLDEVRNYLDLHTGPHRILSAREALGAIRAVPSTSDN